MAEEMEKQAEKLARQISKKRYNTTALWELCLPDAYKQITEAMINSGTSVLKEE